jgi:hypothetical protein
MNRDDALKKIKKCLALAASSNANEASVALHQAQRLMHEHSVSMTEMELLEVSQSTSQANNLRACTWEVALTAMINQIFGTQTISQIYNAIAPPSSSSFFKQKRRVVFIGLGASAELAGYCHDVLLRQIVKARKTYMAKLSKNCKPATRIARGDEFAFGFVSSMSDKITALKPSERDLPLIKAYTEERFPDLKMLDPKDRTKGQNVKRDDWMVGRIEGRSVNLNAGVGGGQKQELLA